MDRFTREPRPDGDVVRILSTCALCGAKLLSSRYDDTVDEQERAHRKTCGRFVHSLSAEGAVIHSTCVKCGLLIQARIDHPIAEMEETHLQGCPKHAE
jgi:hypothetical protein